MLLLAQRMSKEIIFWDLISIYQRDQNPEIEFRLVFEIQCLDQRTENGMMVKVFKTRRTVSKKAVLVSGVNYLNKSNAR